MIISRDNDMSGKYYIYNNLQLAADKIENSIVMEGKCIYEVIRIIKGVPLFLEKHLWRLDNSSKLGEVKLIYDNSRIKKIIDDLIAANDAANENIKLVFNENGDFLAYIVKHSYPEEKDYKEGVATILYHAERNNPNAKIINLDMRQKVDVKLEKYNAYEAILVDNNGFITEGSRSNIFLVKGDKVYTSPLTEVLPGITRQTIIELCRNNNIDVSEDKISYKNIDKFDALFITGTSPKVLPVKIVDNVEFTSYSNNIVLKIMKAYNDTIEEYVNNYK